MREKLISVIIPVYNVERYLSKCIDSIRRQTYENLEIILIDDGSTDKSLDICNKYALVDERIRVVHKENAGVSVARNVGVEYSTGYYVCFVDSDDFLPLDSIEKLYKGIKESGSDLCCGAWAKIYAKKTVYNHYCSKNIDTSEKELLSEYLNYEEVNGPVAKLYKKEIIDSADIKFLPGVLIGEDAIFNYQYIQKCQSVSIIDEIVYYYNKLNGESVTHNFYENYNKCSLLCAVEQAKNILSKEYPENSCLVQEIICKRFLSAINYIIYYHLPEERAITKLEETYYIFKGYISPDTIFNNKEYFGAVAEILKYFEDNEYLALCTYLQMKERTEKNNFVKMIKRIFFRGIGRLKLFWIYRFV